MIKIISKKKLTVLTVTMMLMFVLATVAYADYEIVTVDGRFAVHSDPILSSSGATCSGYNYEDSEDRLFMVLEYSDGGGWANQAVTAMAIDSGAELSSDRPGGLQWRVTLNPDELAYCLGMATIVDNNSI